MRSPRPSASVESPESRLFFSHTADAQDSLPDDPAAARPNIVFILTDDLDAESVK